MQDEKAQMREEFNVQRAKLKDLFIQKEGKTFEYYYQLL